MKVLLENVTQRTEALFECAKNNKIETDTVGIMRLYGECVKLFYDITEGDCCQYMTDDSEIENALSLFTELYYKKIKEIDIKLRLEEYRLQKKNFQYTMNYDGEAYRNVMKKYGLAFPNVDGKRKRKQDV